MKHCSLVEAINFVLVRTHDCLRPARPSVVWLLVWSLAGCVVVSVPACRSSPRQPTLAGIAPPALPDSRTAVKPTAPPETRTKPVEAALATSLSPEQSDMSLASASVALPTAENHLFAANDAAPLGNVISNESVGNPIVAPTTAASFAANSSTPPEVPIQQEQFAASPQGSSTVAVVAASNQATSQVSPPASPQSQVSQPSASNHAQVVIAGVRPGRGIVHVAIFTEGKGFPNAQSAVRTASLASDTESVTTELSERGRVAIAVYQDINGDGTLNVNRFGIPTEPFAFSNNAMGNRGPPTFDDAAIDVGNTQLSPRPIRIQLP